MKPKQRVVKKSKLRKLGVPDDLKSRKMKKFKTKDRKFLVLVLSAGGDAFEVVRIATGQSPMVIRKFDCVGDSQVSMDIRRRVARSLALWFGRQIALHNMVPPSARKERSQRKSETRKALAAHQTHHQIKSVMHAVTNPRTAVPKRVLQRIPLPYVFLYDPKGGPKNVKQPTTFVVHQATCPQLDGRRRSVRKRGASWIVEETSAERAIVEQIREFDSEDKGYDRTDFTIHRCELC